jgi:hypothetical protein
MKRVFVLLGVALTATFAFADLRSVATMRTKPLTGKVTAVSSAGIAVTAENGESHKATSSPTHAKYVNVGQLAWLYPNEIKLVEFPIEMERKTKVGDGDWMKTTVKLSNTGILRGTTKTWTTACQDGFTGGFRVILMAKDGNDLYITKLRKYGVNGTCIPSAPSSRTESWDDNVPLDRVKQTAKIAIVHIKKPTDRIDEFLEKAKEVAEIAKTFSEAYANASSGSRASK